MTLPAAQALYPLHIAVKLDNLVISDACLLMQPIYILSDDAIQLAQFVQLRHSFMGGIRLHIIPIEPYSFAHLPDSLPGFAVADKSLIGEVLGVELGPETVGTPEIGYARLGADARACEHHHLFGVNDKVGNLLDKLIQRFAALFLNHLITSTHPKIRISKS
jgi:hypothetical protein